MNWFDALRAEDPEIFGAIKNELQRRREGLELIPSENHVSVAVMQAMGSVLNDKYSEGYPGHRYYGGTKYIDDVERTAIERAKELFGVPHANVQGYSGSPANLAVYFAVCNVGDVIMGQNLTDGGHLTHGWKTSITGKIFKSVSYHTKPDGYIDIDEVRKLAEENHPKLIWVGATAYTREFPFEELGDIADSAGAFLAADISHIAGLIVGGVHKSPVNYAHIITSTTHKTLRGPRGALIMVTEKGLKKDPELDSKIDKVVFPGLQGGPHEHTIAGIAVALLEDSKPEFKEYAAQVVKNAKALADELNRRGIKLVTGGTDNHMLLADFSSVSPGFGQFAEEALDRANITVNKNTIPGEPSSPFYPSGIRLGTPSVTTRGMKEGEMKAIGGFIAEAVQEIKGYKLPGKAERPAYIKKFREEILQNEKLEEVKNGVMQLCARFPLYPELSM
ncbi:MAG: serine hydroxymethyltransferase [Candidatus Micrarchaeota archaeon]|nr:serine hydroxymethyltransferase [Candidatus Micrarchaeota archaeon]